MRYHFTCRDVIEREVIPLLGHHAKYFDFAGFTRRFVEYDPGHDVYFMPANTPWRKIAEHALRLDVRWTAAPDEYNALYEIYTPHTRAEDTVLGSGYFKATEDAHESLTALDSALQEEGVARGLQLTSTGDHERFELYWIE